MHRTEIEVLSIPQVQPLDDHNRALVENVHPPDWENPRPSGRYNLVVIGGGTAGLVTAAGAAGLGAKVALIERRLLGGDCLNVGCVPSKALIRSARARAAVAGAEDFGVRVPRNVTVDFGAVMERMRRLRAKISSHDSAKRFNELGVEVFLGSARFSGPDTVDVDGATLRFSRACIAAGSSPVAPPIDGLENAGYLTNETLFSLTELPRRLAVLGGGPIGCEMAQTFARLGSEVRLIEMADQVLVREDRDAASVVQRALGRDGVELLFGSKLAAVEPASDGKVLVIESKDGGENRVTVDEVLVAVGRAPNVAGLDLEAAGIEYDRKAGIRVDDNLRTTNRNIFAAGDICFRYKFTHVADALARIVIQNALFFGRAKASALTVPWCTYTSPEIAHVGLYEKDAEERGIDVETFRLELSEVDRPVLDGEEEGFLKVHVRKGKDRILGATLVAEHAGDMISEITAVMAARKGLGVLSRTIHPYPTQAEVFRKAGDAYNRGRLKPWMKKAFETLFAWRR